MDFASIWFFLLFVLLIGYAVLDGFDLGVGVLHVLARDEHERRIGINAIAPVWDGNEVWLLAAGGSLFAAFPPVYATVFSAFYTAMMLLLVALIARAVSMEFRSKVESLRWRRFWDGAFFAGSVAPPVIFGVALGNVLRGIPLGADGQYTGTLVGLLNPYALLIGVLTLAAFTMHGGIYLAGKSDGAMKDRLVAMLPRLWIVFIDLYIMATIATAIVAPQLLDRIVRTPWIWLLLPMVIVSAGIIPFMLKRRRLGQAFAASSLAVGSMVALAGASLYPNLVPARADVAGGLSIFNSASTPRTLKAMFIIALIGMPLVIGYTFFVYRIFRGKVVIGEESY